MSRILTGTFPAIIKRPPPPEPARQVLVQLVSDLQLLAGELPEAIESLAEQAQRIAAPLRVVLRAEATIVASAPLSG